MSSQCSFVRAAAVAGALGLLFANLAACGGDDDGVTPAPDAAPADAAPVSLDVTLYPPDPERPWVPGYAQLTYTVEPRAISVAHVELYVDGVLDHAVDAPMLFDSYYVLDWDARSYSEGTHQLRLVAKSPLGAQGESEIMVHVDQHDPAVVLTGTSVVDGKEVAHYDVTDSGAGVERVRLLTSDQVLFLTAPPYDITLADCSQTRVEIEAVDGSGRVTHFEQDVRVARACDDDCDGFTAATAACGGDDCNDAESIIHPGAADPVGDLLDADCDDVDGVDADGDGVPSIASGGTDCADTDGTSHPAWWNWRKEKAASASVANQFALADIALVGGRLAMVWMNSSNLSYAERAADGTWSAPLVLDSGTGHSSRSAPRILAGPDGRTSITYNGEQSVLHMATLAGPDVTTERIGPEPLFAAFTMGLGADSTGHRHVLAQRGLNGGGSARYFTDASGAWTEELTNLRGDRAVDLFVGADDVPRILYLQEHTDGPTDLEVLARTPTGWSVESVLASGALGVVVAATQTADGRLAAAYSEADHVRVVVAGAPAIDLGVVSGLPAALESAADGRLHVLVADSGGMSEFVAGPAGAERVGRLAVSIYDRFHSSFMVDPSGTPHLGYVTNTAAVHAWVDRQVTASADIPGNGVDEDCDGRDAPAP